MRTVSKWGLWWSESSKKTKHPLSPICSFPQTSSIIRANKDLGNYSLYVKNVAWTFKRITFIHFEVERFNFFVYKRYFLKHCRWNNWTVNSCFSTIISWIGGYFLTFRYFLYPDLYVIIFYYWILLFHYDFSYDHTSDYVTYNRLLRKIGTKILNFLSTNRFCFQLSFYDKDFSSKFALITLRDIYSNTAD